MTIDAQNTTVEAVLPTHLVAQMESLVAQGWFPDIDDLIVDAVRRFLEAHSLELIEHFLARCRVGIARHRLSLR